MNISSRIEKHFAVAAAAVAVAGAANAAIVTWNINALIPNNVDGLYINIATQTTGTSGSSTPGWDINPYGSNALVFYATGGSPNPVTTYVRTQGSGGPSSLAVGTVIGGTSTFANSSTAVISTGGVGANGWTLNSVNYFGFRFNPGSTAGVVRYGYGVMQVGATASARTLLAIVWGDAGESVTVTAIPAPGALALLGVAGLVSRRRR
jgi:MYXO-CTERM domain-containing protein